MPAYTLEYMATSDSKDAYATIAELYDLEHDAFTEDLEFYHRIVVAGPVLEIGCGTGRVLESLLESGLEVWGVDPSEAMLDRARVRLAGCPSVHLTRGTAEDLDLPVSFATAIFSLNALWHVCTAEGQLRALTLAARHLEAGGMVVVDTANPLTLADHGARGEWRRRFYGSNRVHAVECDSASWDDQADQLLETHVRYDLVSSSGEVSRRSTVFTFRYVYAAEMRLMLQLAGLTRIVIFGSYDEDPYDELAPNLIAVGFRPQDTGAA